MTQKAPLAKRVFRVETVGSLLRPDALKRARDDLAAGRIGRAEFKRIEDRAVDEAIALQERAGLEVVTDGEMRRLNFVGPLAEAVSGLEDVPSAPHRWHGSSPNDEADAGHARAITGKLRRRRSLALEEFVYARARATLPVKQTLPSPLMLQTFWSPEHSPAAYSDPFELFQDAADLVRDEIRDLVDLGCEYIQIDAPELAILVDPSVRDAFVTRGIDPDRVLGEGIEILNGLVTIPGPLFGLHLCRGNREGRWMAAGGYDAISRAVFTRATRFDVFLLEYDDERSGGFAPLRDIPDEKVVVLGLISSKRPDLEDPAELLARIDEAARYHPRELLSLSPQCGFASALGGNPLTVAEQERKLRLVSDTAATAWPA
jgi:5-methyltetrahydropteroyltriglutamate--homocysteine methyltransferase